MQCKRACLVINPRDGQNLVKLPDILAIFSAAGWHTDLALKEYGGHTMELATKAARQEYDLVVAYGGDGTLNQVVNGVMNGKGAKSVVAVLPGGTVNQWAAEVSVPPDPVRAALALVTSDVHEVDVAHVEVTSLTFPSTSQQDQPQPTNNRDIQGKNAREKVKPTTPKARHHFLLMAGLGIDAAIMGQVNKSLKHKIGVAAVGLTSVEKLSEQRAFPVEIRVTEPGSDTKRAWQGNAIQVIIGNTRRYAGAVEMTSDALIDDGVLDICVITAGDPLSTMQQISSLLFRRKPDNRTTEFFSGAYFTISVPASIAFHVDGSAVNLKDYLSKSDRKALRQAENAEQVMVNYRFDALPHALKVAIPYTYDDTLFEKSHHEETSPTTEQQEQQEQQDTASQQPATPSDGEQPQSLEHLDALLEDGRKVTIVGATTRPEEELASIIAGTTLKPSTGEARPVAICIDDHTTLLKRTGEPATIAEVQRQPPGSQIVVVGKKSKRGVIHATRLVL